MLDREWDSRFVYLDIIIYIKRERQRDVDHMGVVGGSLLKRRHTKDANWPENTQTVQKMCKHFHRQASFGDSSNVCTQEVLFCFRFECHMVSPCCNCFTLYQ